MNALDQIVSDIAAYHPSADLELVRRAYDFAAKAHHGQTRKSGEPYVTHPLAVASIISELKLDIAFIRDAVESNEAAAIVGAIISIANSLNLEVVAEGVETQAQCDFLVESGCTTMQGYLLSRPVTGDAITELLRRGSSRAISEPDVAMPQAQ